MNQPRRGNNRLLTALAIAACMMCSSAVYAADVRVTSTTFVTKPSNQIELHTASSQANGTSLVEGRDTQGRLWFIEFSNEPKLLWQTVIDAKERDTRVYFLFGAGEDE